MIVGCICGGSLEAMAVIMCGGVLIGWLTKLIHRLRCRCKCHDHVCVDKAKEEN